MGKYFGTDGFRGEAGITLTADHAYKVGRFLGWYYNMIRERNNDHEPARIVIGKDTRRSSYMFEYSLVAGLTASGADAYLLHVTTTPSVAYIARVDDFDCGIMISASHNPYYDNGIKLIDCYGEKMPEEILLLVEDYIDGKLHVFDKDWPELPFAHREHIGCTVDYVSGRNRYMGYLISLGVYSFKGVKVGLDCANGSSWNIAKSVFDALGADTYVINNKLVNPTGRFVLGGSYADCGVTGRKLACDTYGGIGRMGGGALSGKDPTKVDRSAAYMARKIAKDIVQAGYADKCEVQLAYAIGVVQPVGVAVECFGTEHQPLDFIQAYVKDSYDLTPQGIIQRLGLLDMDYNKVSAYGHFGKPSLPWEE
ncbi:hypothetical protein MCC02041_22250 [Faecalibacterium prausnitzii]|uniref:methionine adenosyltransferase domain-containing protein n=1 Tax=Faecalibacterium prausnitzii TaxID=853 RepID=UPI001B0ADD5F|nr:hypothetical protein MCC02041_22250 [Faecalibacterium prausnitzii]